jgi:hypothetical protein
MVLRLAVVFGVGVIGATVSSAFTPAFAVDASHVSFTLEGCRGSAGSFPPLGPFVCADALYTTGNLGSGWNELDLVPHRLTASAGNSAPLTQVYVVAIVADNLDGGVPGYDFVSAPVKNTALSNGTCSLTSVGALLTVAPGIGGTDTSLYRLLTITQARNSTCVFDYYERLALGSHLFPGSSLHSNAANEALGTAGIGARDVSIPVKEILPQSISKTMAATQDQNFLWTVGKLPSPATLTFSNTCADTAGSRQASLTETVTWTRTGPFGSGGIHVVTDVYATNPSHRVITVEVTDVIKDGSTVLDTATTPVGGVDVPANTANFLVLHHEFDAPASVTNLNDLATATYIDKITGIPVPGTTTATASAIVQSSGVQNNASAVITDVETITGAGLRFSVDSVSLGGGTLTYDNDANPATPDVAYPLGTATVGPVTWTSPVQSASGSAIFGKTVYVDQPRITSGTLADTATALASPGGSVLASAPASVAISSNALVSLTISKSIPIVLTAADGTQVFTFDITGPGGYSAIRTISFGTGEGGSGSPKSVTILGLAPGIYTVHEQTLAPWAVLSDQVVDLSASPSGVVSNCSGTATFANRLGPASAKVLKVTVPAGHEAGWVFRLTGPGTPVGGETVTTTGASFVFFTTVLQEGSYTITEVSGPALSPGFAPGVPSGECSFTVNYPADAGRVFACTFTNTQNARVTVTKTVSGAPPPAGTTFTFQIRTGASASSLGTILATDTTDAAGNVDFGGLELAPGTYQLCEVGVPVGWTTTLSLIPGAFVPGIAVDPTVDNSTICVPITLVAGQVLNVPVNNNPPPAGQARTIGYWKNWNTCSKSNGRQTDSLGPALGGGIVIGDLNVTTCQTAVRILSKQDVLTGQNRANDAAYGLAAQLLAAQLNINAGAGSCGAALTAIGQAQALLDAINFTGTGSYLGPKTLDPANRALANSLASTLDSFNNNTLC